MKREVKFEAAVPDAEVTSVPVAATILVTIHVRDEGPAGRVMYVRLGANGAVDEGMMDAAIVAMSLRRHAASAADDAEVTADANGDGWMVH